MVPSMMSSIDVDMYSLPSGDDNMNGNVFVRFSSAISSMLNMGVAFNVCLTCVYASSKVGKVLRLSSTTVYFCPFFVMVYSSDML